LPGATNVALFLPPVQWTNNGLYRVLITDAFGTVTGPGINVNVLPPVLRFDAEAGGLAMTTNGFRLRLLGASGVGALVLYASTNLVVWEPILTNPPSGSPVEFIAPVSSNQTQKFYRVTEVYVP
jgi:hypothetical protein